MANKLINLAVEITPFGAILIAAADAEEARAIIGTGGGGGAVSSVNGQTGAVVLGYSDVGAASAAQGAKADSAATPSQVAAARLVTVRSYSGTSDTFVLEDAGNAVHSTGAAAAAQTIPANSSVAFPVGTSILIRQLGAGAVTVLAGAGVTLLNGLTTAKTAGQYKGSLAVHKIDTDTWYLDGGVAQS